MLYFILFESDECMRELYIKIIKNMMMSLEDAYNIFEFKEYNQSVWKSIEKVVNRTIYLISSDILGTDGFELAKKIRLSGDINSQIIITMPNNRKLTNHSISFTMALNVIKKNKKLVSELFKSLEHAYRIMTSECAHTFSLYDEIYRILYNDIYFIMKNPNDDTITIYTKNDTYMEYSSIKSIMDKLKNDIRFFRTHRSCIVNLHKIVYYNCRDNIISFDNGMTVDLVSRENKKLLIEKLKKNKV